MKDKFIEFETISEIHNAGDLAFVKSLLDARGITYFIQGEHVAHYLYNAVPMRLMVKKDQANEAREIVKVVELSYSYSGLKKLEDLSDD
jgi:hypothetical protein